jgi:hypothetical protein
MLLTGFNQQFHEKILDFLWNQWTQLGVLGRSSSSEEHRVIDPEALLLFSLTQARYDARLFDEIFDWILINERKISLQRLKGLARRFDGSETHSILKAVAGSVYTIQNNIRWKAFSAQDEVHPSVKQTFFLRTDETPIPVFGEYSSIFSAVGWIRSKPMPRGTSLHVPLDETANMIFLLRSLFGLTPRAEIITFIFAKNEVYASDLVEATGYSKPAVYDALSELVLGGFVRQKTGGAGSIYFLPDGMWQNLLRVEREEVHWIDWTRVMSSLGCFQSELSSLSQMEVSEYIVRSKLLTLVEILRRGLTGSGIEDSFDDRFTIDNILERMPEKLLGMRL